MLALNVSKQEALDMGAYPYTIPPRFVEDHSMILIVVIYAASELWLPML